MTALLEMAIASQSAATLRTVILKALSDADIFCGFDELAAVCSPVLKDSLEGAVLLKTLELFSYGSITDYSTSAPGTYLPLSDMQSHKLLQLTVLDAVQRACWKSQAVVAYSEMYPADETTIVSCIYAGLFHGQLCQTTQTLSLDPSSPIRSRDVVHVNDLLSALRRLFVTLEATHSSLEGSKAVVLAQKQALSVSSKAKSGQRPPIESALARASAASQKSNKRTRGDTTLGRF